MSWPPDPELRAELLRRVERDQAARMAWWDDPDRDWTPVRAVDSENLPFLIEQITRHGWLGSDLVGVDGAHACWLMSQHAPSVYQHAWLPLMSAAVEHGLAERRDLVYLADRVAMHRDQPQRYGTQSLGWADTDTRLWPLRNPGEVNTWRTEVGLEPLTAQTLASVWTLTELADRGRVVSEAEPDEPQLSRLARPHDLRTTRTCDGE